MSTYNIYFYRQKRKILALLMRSHNIALMRSHNMASLYLILLLSGTIIRIYIYKALLMSIHNICFCRIIRKIFTRAQLFKANDVVS